MVSELDTGANGLVLSPGWNTRLCSWAIHFSLTVPLSTQVFEWVLVNSMLKGVGGGGGGNPVMDYHPI